MQDLINQIKLVLDNALFDLGIHSHYKRRKDEEGNEYVIFSIVSMPFVGYANNKPILQEQNVDVNYYALNSSFNYERISLIQTEMSSEGWKLITGESSILGLVDGLNGVTMEFTRERVL